MEINLKGMREFRDKHFKVKVKKSDHGLYKDEKTISVTHNGYQWTSISVNEREAILLINELDKKFHLGLEE